jgi:AcrR family transcriptional regulator
MTQTINSPNLKEACVQAAREVIAEHGVEGWSMRDVARKLGISHQAPYRHFASRDHLLAEIMRRCFEDFAEFLDQASKAQPSDELGAMGCAYMAYADKKPLEYRLMFGTPWPEPADHPELVKHAVHAFDLLRQNLMNRNAGLPDARKRSELQALFIWSSLHGLASIKHANVMQHLVLSRGVENKAQDFMLEMIDSALVSQANAFSKKTHD